MNSLYITLVFLISFMQSVSFCKVLNPPKIAIVGAGVGGASSAYFLRQLFGADVDIDVYERDVIGGRLATTEVNGQYFEVGGSVIHPKNKYMVQFMDLLGLEKRPDRSSSTFGLYDGKNFVFKGSEYFMINIMKMLWRYGLDPMKLDSTIDSILNKFDRVYELQNSGKCFETVEQLLYAMSPSFVDALTNSTYTVLKEYNFSDQIINELVRAALRVNYGQDTDIHFFVGSVSLAGTADRLFSIKGGNKKVPEKLLKHSNVVMIPGEVRVIQNTNHESHRYLLNYTINQPDVAVNIARGNFYDIIVIARPMTLDLKNQIEFLNFPNPIQFSGNYHRTVCTIVHGDLKLSYFGLDEVVTDILTINNDTFFNSVSLIDGVNRLGGANARKNYVWKVFSQNILTDIELDTLFSKIESKKVFNWMAYPHYTTSKRFDTFMLYDHLYHVNAIEWAASAMEMSVIGAKNVALLAYEAWTKTKVSSNDDQSSDTKRKFEL